MATRIAFSTHYPDRMKDLSGKPTRFPEKILKGIYDGTTYYIGECPNCAWVGSTYHCAGGGQIADTGDYSDPGCPKCFSTIEDSDYDFGYYGHSDLHPKTTTIRKNYDYWKSKEGKLLQPFFWAGKPYRSKHVVFCPEVRLASVLRINLDIYEKNIFITAEENDGVCKKSFISLLNWKSVSDFTKDEGFDQPDHFWMWFNQDFDGAYLELESVEG